jgi:hypothetical protein
MNVRALTVAATAVGFLFAACLIPLEAWPESAKSLLTVLAILAAGVLVRLNRGLPTIDWSKVNPESRGDLVKKMRDISVEYGITLAQIGVLLVGLLASEMIDLPVAGYGFYDIPPLIRAIVSGFAGGSLIFVFSRMVYIVWRDIDIVELQADVITEAATSEVKVGQQTKAKAIKSAGVKNPHRKMDE